MKTLGWWLLFFVFAPLHLFSQEVEVQATSYYVDASKSWDVEAAYANKSQFRSLTADNASLGFNKGTVYIYIKVKNLSSHYNAQVAEFPYPLHDSITVYEKKQGSFVKLYETGDLLGFDTRKVESNDFVIPYTLEASQTKELMFVLRSNSSLNIGLNLLSQEQYYSATSKHELFLGSYYGAVFIMLIYNFILFLIIKESVYLDYVTFHFSYLFLHLGLNGLAF